MTIQEIARDINRSEDTVYNRIRCLQEEKKPIHVCGWRVSSNTLARVFGYGTNADAPRPGLRQAEIVETKKQPILRRYLPIPYLEIHQIWDAATHQAVLSSHSRSTQGD